MQITVYEQGNSRVAVVHSPDIIFTEIQDALDLMAAVRHLHGCDKIVVNKLNICDGFFDLKTGLAGAILQKFTNYRMKIAIVGDFGSYSSKALRDFIFESNNGNQVLFLPDEATAVQRLHRTI